MFHSIRSFFLEPINTRLDRLERKLDAVFTKETEIMAALDDLITEVTEIETTGDSVIALVNGLAAQIYALNIPDPRLADLVTRLKSQATKFSTAVQANTPAGPPTP